MLHVYELGRGMHLRVRGDRLYATLLVVAGGAVYECEGLTQAATIEHAPGRFRLAMWYEGQEEPVEREYEGEARWQRGFPVLPHHSELLRASPEGFRVVSWDDEACLRVMFRYSAPTATMHVSLELALARVC